VSVSVKLADWRPTRTAAALTPSHNYTAGLPSPHEALVSRAEGSTEGTELWVLSVTNSNPWINGPLHDVLFPTTQSSTISIAVPWLLD
jgi:hypothetical protein